MDPTSEDPQDQQLSDHIEPTEGHLPTHPLHQDNDRESIQGGEQTQFNVSNDREFGPEQETPLLVFLGKLPEKKDGSSHYTASNHSSISQNDVVHGAALDIPGETVANDTGDAAAGSTTSATVGFPINLTTPTSPTTPFLADGDMPFDTANDCNNPSNIDLTPELRATLEDEVNIRSLQPRHETPLHVAVRKGHIKIIERLIEAGADLDALDDNDVQPLHVACEIGDEEVIVLLLNSNATTAGPDHDGWCLLHYASFFDMNADVLQRLVEADRKYLNNKELFEGWTPINRATWFGRQSVVDALLQAGVDLGIADKNGWTPMMTAIEEENFQIFDKMVDYLAQVGSDYVQAQKDVIDQRDDEGMTVLMTLCVATPTQASESSLTNLLQKLRPTANITDNIDQTALDHAMALAKKFDNDPAQNIAREVIKWWPEQTLLRQNMANETAFDDASGPLLNAMVNRLKGDFLLRDKLLYYGTNIIEELKEFNPAPYKKSNTDRKDELTPRQVLDEIGDILNFLPQMRSKNPKTRWKASLSTEDMSKSLDHYNSAVVWFRQRELEAFRFRKVDKVVYGDLPITVITLGQIEQSDLGSAAGSMKQDLSDTENTFTWVHLPATNMDWMKNTVVKIMKTQSDGDRRYQEKLASFLQASWIEIPDKTSASRFMRPRYVRMQPEGVTAPNRNITQQKTTAVHAAGSNPGVIPEDDGKTTGHDSISLQCPASALYMPFLVVSQYDEGEVIEQQNDTTMPQPSERRYLFSAYKDSVIHDSPTLDEHYYHFAEDKHSADDRKERNRTQVISKHLAPYADEKDMPKTILRVSQLWAWTIGDKWLITSTSCAKMEKASEFVEEIREHIRRRTDDGSLNGGLRSPQELSKVIAEYCIGSYERKHRLETRRSEPTKQDQQSKSPVRSSIPPRIEERSIRQVFSDFINEIGRKETALFSQFAKQPVELDEKHSRAKDHSLTIAQVLGATRRAADLLFQIKDVRDELHILKTIADYQEKVQTSIDKAIHGTSNAAFDENMKAKYVRNDIDELDTLADNIQEAVS